MFDGAAADTRSGSSWVGEALDGVGSWSLRAKAPWLLGLLMLFDSWDSTVIAYVLPVLREQWGLSALQSGWLASAGYGGQFLGAIVFGSLAERHGRLPVLKLLVLVMCLLALACALAGGYNQLIGFRAVQGLTIGGALPIAICYINEVAPTATRGRFFGTFQFLMTSGFGLAALASAWLIPAFGWRIMFGLGAAPLIALPFMLMLPESPRWLVSRGRVDEAGRSLERLGSGSLPALLEAGESDDAEVVRYKAHGGRLPDAGSVSTPPRSPAPTPAGALLLMREVRDPGSDVPPRSSGPAAALVGVSSGDDIPRQPAAPVGVVALPTSPGPRVEENPLPSLTATSRTRVPFAMLFARELRATSTD